MQSIIIEQSRKTISDQVYLPYVGVMATHNMVTITMQINPNTCNKYY